MQEQLSLALWQRSPEPPDAAEFCAALERVVADSGAHLVITPELCWPGYGNGAATRAAAVAQDSDLIARIRHLAARHSTALVLGYSEDTGAARYNSAICIGPDGAILQNYRKRMLANDYERACFQAGGQSTVFTLCGVPVAMLICYDAEFPERVRQVAQAGAQLIVVPTALSSKWRVVSDVVIRSRAYENGVFMAYCNFAATAPDFAFTGLSTVAGPDGQALVQAGHASGVIRATLDLAQLRAVREELHFLRDLTA